MAPNAQQETLSHSVPIFRTAPQFGNIEHAALDHAHEARQDDSLLHMLDFHFCDSTILGMQIQ